MFERFLLFGDIVNCYYDFLVVSGTNVMMVYGLSCPHLWVSLLLKLWPIFGNERQMCLSYHGYVAEFGESCVRLPPVNQGSFIDNERIIFLIANF